MKKLFLTFVVALLFASSSFAGIVIKVELEIGRKSIPNCPGFGICSIKVSVDAANTAIMGNLVYDKEKSTVVISIPESEILRYQPDKLVYFKDKSTVTFMENVTFPADVCLALKSSNQIVIKNNTYSITYNKGVYYIEVPI
jgi:hypothetical protein